MKTNRPRRGFRHVVCGLVIPLLMVSSLAALGFADDETAKPEHKNLKVRELKRWYAEKKKERLEVITSLRENLAKETDADNRDRLEVQIGKNKRGYFMPPALDVRTAKVGDVGMIISYTDTPAAGEFFFGVNLRGYPTVNGRRVKLFEVVIYEDKKEIDREWIVWKGGDLEPPRTLKRPPYDDSNNYYHGTRPVLALVEKIVTVEDETGKRVRAPLIREYAVPSKIEQKLPGPRVVRD